MMRSAGLVGDLFHQFGEWAGDEPVGVQSRRGWSGDRVGRFLSLDRTTSLTTLRCPAAFLTRHPNRTGCRADPVETLSWGDYSCCSCLDASDLAGFETPYR